VVSWELVMVGLKGCRTSTGAFPSQVEVVGDKDLSIRGKDQRLRKNRLVPNGDQVLVTTLDVQVPFGQNDDVGDDLGDDVG
jgi:hypothetical protein